MSDDYTFDLHRILLGDLSWLLLVEIALRTTIMYGFALFMVRLLGKRGQSQLAPFDFVIIIALGSAVGDPMFYPDVPILHSLVAIAVVVSLTQGVVRLTERNEALDKFLSAEPALVVEHGCLSLDSIHKEGLSRAELFQALRGQGVEQLGAIERAYIEPSGHVSVFTGGEHRPGVPLFPEGQGGWPELHAAGEQALSSVPYACWRCGCVRSFVPGTILPKCVRCESEEWVPAVMSMSDWTPKREV